MTKTFVNFMKKKPEKLLLLLKLQKNYFLMVTLV